MKQKIGAVVIGGGSTGLGLVRALAREGITVSYLDTVSTNPTRFSRYCFRFIKLSPNVFNDEKRLVESLIAISEKGILNNVIFPTDEKVVGFIAKNKVKLAEYYIVPVPDWKIVQRCYNKKNTYAFCKNYGINFPKSYFPDSIEDLYEQGDTLQYPLIIKPAISSEFLAKTGHKVIVVMNRNQLGKNYKEACTLIRPENIILQEIIPGPTRELYSFVSFFKNGKVVSGFTARRSRQIPVDFGRFSTLVELCEIPELFDLGEKILKAIEYYGISEVEFKKDPRDGKYKLLDVNPRPWYWHALAPAAGMNLSYLMYLDMIGEVTKPMTLIHNNMKFIDFRADLRVSFREILKGRLGISEYFQSFVGKKTYPVFSFNDPLPFIMETLFIPYFFSRNILKSVKNKRIHDGHN